MNRGLHGFGVMHKKTISGVVANIRLVFVRIVCGWTEPKSHFILFRVWEDTACVELI